MYFILPCPFQPPGNSCWFYEQLFPGSLFFRELQWCGKNVIQHYFFLSFLTHWGGTGALCEAGMFFFTGFCTQCQCPGEKYLLKPTEQVAAQVSCCLVLSLCFWPLWPWCCAGKSALVWCLWLLCFMCLWWVFYRGGNRRQQRVKSWTRSKAATLMETLPRYQPLRYLFLHEQFFWFLNLVGRRDRANELSFLPSDPSIWI